MYVAVSESQSEDTKSKVLSVKTEFKRVYLEGVT